MGLTTQELSAHLHITLSGVAQLARVQRPAVTMWRSRTRGSDDPFPAPVGVVDRVEEFDAEAVAAWLQRTGRGNNATVIDDVAAFARPAGMPKQGEAARVHAMTALLCLKAMTGAALGALDVDGLLDAADAADPDDVLIAREIIGLRAQLTPVARYVNRLADAAFSPALAFEQLLADRDWQQLTGLAHSALHPHARRLVAVIAQGLAQDLDPEPPVFVDPTLGAGDLLMEVAGLYTDGPSPTFVVRNDDAMIGRLARRRLRVHDLHTEPLHIDTDGSFQIFGGAVHVAQFATPHAPTMTDLDILAAIDNVVLQMDDRQCAVIIAPAAILTDRLSSPDCVRVRDDLLRTDRVRAIVRLPKGLLVSAPRQPFALWALGPADPSVRIGDRWTVVGDLGDVALTPAVIEGVVSDVVAAMGGYRLVRAHAFGFARGVKTAGLLAGRGSLLRPGAVTLQRTTNAAGDILVRVADLTDALGFTDDSAARGLSVQPVERPDEHAPPRHTLGQLVDGRAVRLVPGNRIDEADLRATSGAPVIGTPEITGTLPWGERFIDRLAFAADYPAGRLTRPGDVVFCTSPWVAARVDAEGGSIVMSPARVLRPAGHVVSQVLAADINGMAPHASQWQLWSVRTTPDDQAEPLTALLTAIEQERQAAQQRLIMLDELADLIIEGVTTTQVLVQARALLPSGRSPTPPVASATEEEAG